MRNILICGYRDWAHDLFVNVDRCVIDNCVYVDDKDMLDTMIDEYEPKFIFFIGWSWIIKDDIINNYPCICLHPSPLPKYRGGSPMQHQIINGEKTSAVTLFEMDEGIDTGDILYQKEFSLDGDLNEIYRRIRDIGTDGVIEILENGYQNQIKQNEEEATFYKRRKPSMSEITIDDISNFTASQLHDKVRALQDPYPNAFITCKDGTKLYIKRTEIE